MTDTKIYIIERNCCTSGQCIMCKHLPRGDKVRVEHLRTLNKKLAQECAGNYSEYDARITTRMSA